jgi:hypothetical protein
MKIKRPTLADYTSIEEERHTYPKDMHKYADMLENEIKRLELEVLSKQNNQQTFTGGSDVVSNGEWGY